MALRRRTLGRNGLNVSVLCLGCMGMSEFYGGRDDNESIATIQRALDLGVTFLDTEATCRALGVGFVAYSPLGRGFLTGQVRRVDGLAADDFRRRAPRFQGENLQRNLDLVTRVQAVAQEKGCTPGQLALAWLLAQGDDIVPIPGTKRRRYLEENVGTLDVTLTPADLSRIDEVAPRGATAGDRYAPEGMRMLNR